MKIWKYTFSFLLVTIYPFITFAQISKIMNEIEHDQKGDLLITPSKSSTQNDFDFLEGKWNIHNKKLKSRLNNSNEWIEFDAIQEMRKVLREIGNVDNLSATLNDKPYEGRAVRLFNPAIRLWSIYWADNLSGTMDKPVVGSFENKVVHFFAGTALRERKLLFNLNGMPTILKNPSGARLFLLTMVKHGNGIGSCILPKEEISQ